jgi:hypothetical protein
VTGLGVTTPLDYRSLASDVKQQYQIDTLYQVYMVDSTVLWQDECLRQARDLLDALTHSPVDGIKEPV